MQAPSTALSDFGVLSNPPPALADTDRQYAHFTDGDTEAVRKLSRCSLSQITELESGKVGIRVPMSRALTRGGRSGLLGVSQRLGVGGESFDSTTQRRSGNPVPPMHI